MSIRAAEQLTCSVSDDSELDIGQMVTVRYGLETAWHGRVNEIGRREGEGRSTTQIAALGYGSKFTDKRIQMIYADQDLTHWASSTARSLALLGIGYGKVAHPAAIVRWGRGHADTHADRWCMVDARDHRSMV